MTAGCPQQQHCVMTTALPQHTLLYDSRLSSNNNIVLRLQLYPNTWCSTTAGCLQQHCVMTTTLPQHTVLCDYRYSLTTLCYEYKLTSTHGFLWQQILLNNVLWLQPYLNTRCSVTTDIPQHNVLPVLWLQTYLNTRCSMTTDIPQQHVFWLQPYLNTGGGHLPVHTMWALQRWFHSPGSGTIPVLDCCRTQNRHHSWHLSCSRLSWCGWEDCMDLTLKEMWDRTDKTIGPWGKTICIPDLLSMFSHSYPSFSSCYTNTCHRTFLINKTKQNKTKSVKINLLSGSDLSSGKE